MKRTLRLIIDTLTYLPVQQPLLFLLPLILGTIFFAYHLPEFSLDATTDSLIMKNDPNFNFYNETRANFTSDDYIIVSFQTDDIFTEKNLDIVTNLSKEFAQIETVTTVDSIATAPLLCSPPLNAKDFMGTKNADLISVFKDFINNPPTISNLKQRAAKAVETQHAASIKANDAQNQTLPADEYEELLKTKVAEYIALAKDEILNHPIYSNNLISADCKTTSILINITLAPELLKLEKERADLKAKYEKALATQADNADEIFGSWQLAQKGFVECFDKFSDYRRQRLEKVRKILASYTQKYGLKFYIGGVPVIVGNMIDALEHDIWFFGIGIIVLLGIILFVIFRRFRWMLIPLITCIIVAIWVLGAMAFNGDRGNIITANAITIVFVIAMAHSIHLIKKYREIQTEQPDLNPKDQLKLTLKIMSVPCFYTALTTAAGFASLLITDIEPVLTFGSYMLGGVFVALFVSFTAFPVGVMLLGPSRPPKKMEENREKALQNVARTTIKSRFWLIMLGIAIVGFSVVYIQRISIETKFGEYFPKDGEVYQGLYFIDNEVSGSSPLEIVFEAEKDYFRNPDNYANLDKMMDFLSRLPEIGKVDGIPNFFKVIQQVKEKTIPKKLEFFVKMMLKKLDPEADTENLDKYLYSKFLSEFSQKTLRGYVTPDFSKARILVRIRETLPTLDRKKLIKQINDFIQQQDFKDSKATVTGIFLLYSNLLNSLVSSQINSFGLVFAAVFIMFIILFKSVRIGLIGMLPNVLPIVLVLGIMGFAGKSLDIITIMIASVTMGIAVDSTIHYIFRLKTELKLNNFDYKKAIYRAHETIGQSILFTAVAVIGGFMILTLSTFIPTKFFGLFTGVAMFAALFASLTLLPAIIYLIKPYKSPKH